MITLTGLFVYPIKSARGLAVDRVELDDFGPRWDRRWMVVDDAGRFLTQRTHPRLALVAPSIGATALTVRAPGLPPLEVPFALPRAPLRAVTIFRDTTEAQDAGPAAADWFSRALGVRCALVFMPDEVRRPLVDPRAEGERVGFADAYPLLLVSRASLAALNARLATPVGMDRFRPNLVVDGVGPFAEDGWDRFRIGAVELRALKPCARCSIPSVDQERGERGPEDLLRALSLFRQRERGAMFGMNVAHRGPGALSVGQPVELAPRDGPRPS